MRKEYVPDSRAIIFSLALDCEEVGDACQLERFISGLTDKEAYELLEDMDSYKYFLDTMNAFNSKQEMMPNNNYFLLFNQSRELYPGE